MSKHLRFPLLLLLILLAAGGLPGPALAAAPFDHRGLGPNHPSELPGAGYLLTDPYQGASRAYWAGAYRTIAGQRSYCIDDYYDYPDPRYGYRTSEAAGWLGRPGSNLGANGHTAARIAWIVNRYGASAAPATDAAVSMAINLLMGSGPFNRSYTGYFVAQLNGIDRRIVPMIQQFLTESDRSAGPYRTDVRMGPAPALGGIGHFTVLVRSARGFAVPWSSVTLRPSPGLALLGSTRVNTGHSGVATVRYAADRTGPLSVLAAGESMASTVIRIGYSPTHNSNNFSSGSQRVALISAHPLVPAPPGSGRVRVAVPSLHTVVDGGSSGRRNGAPVSDHVTAAGLGPTAAYRLTVTLQDSTGLVCGTAVSTVRADRRGRLDLHTGPVPVCGGGTDTFTERLTLGRRTIATSPPGQPAETFPVTPTIDTAVAGGSVGRSPRSPVADHVRLTGLPQQTVRVLAVLLDTTGRTCGHVSVPARPDGRGQLELLTPAIDACGRSRDTFVEQVLDSAGGVLLASKPWIPAETFLLRPPPRPRPPTVSPPAAPRPTPPVVVAPTPPVRSGAVPHLAMTGAASRLALVGGLLSFGLGGLVLIASRRT